MKTFEQFQATRREVPDIAAAIPGCDCWDAPQPGYVYSIDDDSGGDGYIEILPGDQVMLVIGNRDWLTFTSNLETLERELYDWFTTELGATL